MRNLIICFRTSCLLRNCFRNIIRKTLRLLILFLSLDCILFYFFWLFISIRLGPLVDSYFIKLLIIFTPQAPKLRNNMLTPSCFYTNFQFNIKARKSHPVVLLSENELDVILLLFQLVHRNYWAVTAIGLE